MASVPSFILCYFISSIWRENKPVESIQHPSRRVCLAASGRFGWAISCQRGSSVTLLHAASLRELLAEAEIAFEVYKKRSTGPLPCAVPRRGEKSIYNSLKIWPMHLSLFFFLVRLLYFWLSPWLTELPISRVLLQGKPELPLVCASLCEGALWLGFCIASSSQRPPPAAAPQAIASAKHSVKITATGLDLKAPYYRHASPAGVNSWNRYTETRICMEN